MIRSLIAALVFLTATTALATPKIGDFANFNVDVEKNGQKASLTLSREITQFNQANNSYMIKQVITMPNGEKQESEDWQTADNFLNDETIDSILANCAQYGGALQEITVPAGKFNTCALKFDNQDAVGIAWVGKVSMGLVRLDQQSKQDSTRTILNLANFR